MFKVVCINNSNRPPEIPTSNWIKEGKEYTVVRVGMNKLTQEKYFVLQEIQPTPPYGGYHINRFRLPHPQAIEAQYEAQALQNTI
jgi:hypothetical protein